MEQKPMNKKSSSASGVRWSILENILTQLFGFLIGIVLARLLTPSDYGTVGVLVIFIAIANVFVDCGFAIGLIRKNNRTEEDLSTAFYFNVIIGLISYGIMFFIAPLVADFFRMPILVILLRVLALCLLFNSFSLVQNAILTAKLKIKTQARINVSTQVIMGCVGIYFAYLGYGVWTLVIQQVGSSFFKCIALWAVGRWRPKSGWNRNSFIYLFNFGWKLLGANLIGTIFEQIHGFFIGRFLGTDELGLFTKAKQLSIKPSSLFLNVINRVALPILAESKDDLIKIKLGYVKMIQLSSFIVFPVFAVLIAVAHPLIIIIWTEKWVDTVLLFQLFCLSVCFAPISQLGLTLLQLLNRTDLTLKFEFIKKPITLILLLITLPYGLIAITMGAIIASLFCTIVNMYATKKLIRYSYIQQIKDMLPYFSLAFVSAGIGAIASYNIDNNIGKLILTTFVTSLIYYFVSRLFLKDTFKAVISIIK